MRRLCFRRLGPAGRPLVGHLGFVLLLTLAAALFAPLAAGQATALNKPPERALSFYNIHTDSHLTVIYRRGDEYVPEGLDQINHALRDPVCGDEHAIDPHVLDFLYDLLEKVRYHGEVQVVCGYRSTETNTMLHNRSNGVVLGSMHIQGRALDFRLPGLDSKYVWETARSMKRGGTGYYKSSDFIHIDTGPVRWW